MESAYIVEMKTYQDVQGKKNRTNQVVYRQINMAAFKMVTKKVMFLFLGGGCNVVISGTSLEFGHVVHFSPVLTGLFLLSLCWNTCRRHERQDRRIQAGFTEFSECGRFPLIASKALQ